MDFSFGIKELNKNEIKLSVSKFSGSIILRKEMCLWIINTLRNATLEDYYTEGSGKFWTGIPPWVRLAPRQMMQFLPA